MLLYKLTLAAVMLAALLAWGLGWQSLLAFFLLAWLFPVPKRPC